MTLSEFNNEFDLRYDNIASKGAPGLNNYEKSVYLTRAQLELIKNNDDLLNKYQKTFEGNEKRRVDLKGILREKSLNPTSTIVNKTSPKFRSTFFDLPSDVFLIKFEKAYLDPYCLNEVEVIPLNHDEIHEKLKNPFREPNNNRCYRIDTRLNKVEIVNKIRIESYFIKYLKYPEPIILVDLITDSELQGLNLSIDGKTGPSESELDKEIHPEIIDRAVQLATLDYRESSLQNKVQINNNNN